MPFTVLKARYESGLYAYRSVPTAILEMLRTEGWSGLYRGYHVTLIRDVPFSGLYLAFYEHLRNGLPISNRFTCNLVSGLVAGGLATIVTHPFDVIKTRVQASTLDLVPAAKSIIKV